MSISDILIVFLVLCAIGVLIWGARALLAILPVDAWWRSLLHVIFSVLIALLCIAWLIQCVRAGKLVAPIW